MLIGLSDRMGGMVAGFYIFRISMHHECFNPMVETLIGGPHGSNMVSITTNANIYINTYPGQDFSNKLMLCH